MSGWSVASATWAEDDDDLDLVDADGNPIEIDPEEAEPYLDWTPAEDDDEDATTPPPVDQQPDTAVEEPDVGTSVNLVSHSSFESARDWTIGVGWTIPSPWGSAFHGSSTARFVGTGIGGEIVTAPMPVDIRHIYWASIQSWMVSWTRGTGTFVLREYDAADVLLRETIIGQVVAANVSWTRLAIRVGTRTYTDIDIGWHPEVVAVRLACIAGGNPQMEWRVDAIHFAQGNPGIYAPAPNEDMDGGELAPGTVPPESFDVTPPAVPVISSVTSEATMDADGKPIVLLHPFFADLPTEEDYAGIEVTATSRTTIADPDDPNSLRSPDWSGRSFDFLAPGDHEGSLPAFAITDYWLRAQSIDVQGNRSAFSEVVEYQTVGDGEAPSIPQGITTFGKIAGVVVSWTRSSAPDLSWYEVRHRLLGATVWGAVLRTRSTVLAVEPLVGTEDADGEPDTFYEFEVRAIDTSGQVQTSETSPIPVQATSDTDAGWSAPVTGAPRLTGADDIAADSILAYHVKAGEITTDKIGAGEILVNTTTDLMHPDGISIRSGGTDTAPELARWDENGLIIWASGANHGDYLRLTSGSISLVKGSVVTAAITPDGIDASAIRFGNAPGGHNLVFNSSFELNAAITAPTTLVHTAAADWTATLVGSTDNLTQGATALSMTSTAF